MMLERCSHPWSDVIYNGFSGGAGAAPPVASVRSPLWPRRAIAFAGGALGVAVIFGGAVLVARLESRPAPAPVRASAPALASAPEPSVGVQTASAAVPPPSTADAATSRPGPPAPPADHALLAASTSPRDVVPPRPRRRIEEPPARGSAFRSRASEATSLANLNEAYAPQSTLSAQAAAPPTPSDSL